MNRYASCGPDEPLYAISATLEGQIEELRAAARDEARRLDEAVAAYRQEYPARLQFPYGLPKYEKPFLVRSMWHDGEFTYVKTDATELPALYEARTASHRSSTSRSAKGHTSCRKCSSVGISRWAISVLHSSNRDAEHGRRARYFAAAPVSDHRPVPRGVLPRRFQTWLMAGLAFGILLIILITGQPEPTQGPTQS